MNLRASTLSWVLVPFAVCALLLRPAALDARELQTVRVVVEQGVTPEELATAPSPGAISCRS